MYPDTTVCLWRWEVVQACEFDVKYNFHKALNGFIWSNGNTRLSVFLLYSFTCLLKLLIWSVYFKSWEVISIQNYVFREWLKRTIRNQYSCFSLEQFYFRFLLVSLGWWCFGLLLFNGRTRRRVSCTLHRHLATRNCPHHVETRTRSIYNCHSAHEKSPLLSFCLSINYTYIVTVQW